MACLHRVKRLQPECASFIMSLLHLGIVHNATLFIYEQRQDKISEFQVGVPYTSNEYIATPSIIFTQIDFLRSSLDQLHFDKFDSTTVFYCDRREHNNQSSLFLKVDYSVWLEPFSVKVWFYLILTLLALSLWLKMVGKKLACGANLFLKFYGSVWGHEAWEVRRYIFLVCGTSFLTVLYANSLLSNVTMVESFEPLKTLKELLDVGFKIIWPLKLRKSSPQHTFGFEFKRLGLSQRLNESFYVEPNAVTGPQVANLMAKRKSKLAAIHATSIAQVTLTNLKYIMQQVDKSLKCYRLEQTLDQTLQNWKINTESRYWMKRTLGRIIESGLSVQWDKWSEWGNLLRKKLLRINFEVAAEPSYINIPKVLPVILLWCVLLAISLILFGFERKQRH